MSGARSTRAVSGRSSYSANSGAKRLLLVVGGPYGFTPEFKQRYGKQAWSLSRLTLTHEMVRLFAVEQIYRACTILRGDPYHHD